MDCLLNLCLVILWISVPFHPRGQNEIVENVRKLLFVKEPARMRSGQRYLDYKIFPLRYDHFVGNAIIKIWCSSCFEIFISQLLGFWTALLICFWTSTLYRYVFYYLDSNYLGVLCLLICPDCEALRIWFCTDSKLLCVDSLLTLIVSNLFLQSLFALI